MATNDVYRWDLEARERNRAAQDKAEKDTTPRLLALVEELAAREHQLLQNRATRDDANTLFVIMQGLRWDLGLREISEADERDLRARWLVVPAPSRLP